MRTFSLSSPKCCHEYSLVIIKIDNHIFKSTTLKSAVKSEFVLLSKSSARSNEESLNEF